MRKVVLLALLTFFCGTVYAQTLHLYGGIFHDVYLGCLNCDRYDSDSVWNRYGNYGSKYNTNSIWNRYGNYGDQYSNTSPWYKYASYPPIVVDKQGNFYVYFTIGTYQDKRAEFQLVLILYKYHEEIREDVSKWYELIFER